MSAENKTKYYLILTLNKTNTSEIQILFFFYKEETRIWSKIM